MSGLSDRMLKKLNENTKDYYVGEQNGDREMINEACREIGIDTAGFDALGSGSGRNVFDMDIMGYPEYALKIAVPHSEYGGLKQNKREVSVWKNANGEQREFLAQIIDYDPDYYWIVMRKGSDVSTVPYQWRTDAKFHLDDVVWKEDIREENVVKINGDYKLCDYGTPP